MGREWSLVAFTITGQLAAGLFLIAGIPIYFKLGNTGTWLEAWLPLFSLTVLVLLALATALSVFHLHHPAKAFRTLANLGRSWLSREILSLLLFAAAAGALAFGEWRWIGGHASGYRRTLFVLGGLAALMLLWTMSKLYMLPSLPSWNRVYTPLSFFLTSTVLGACAMALLLSLAGPPIPRPFLELTACALVASFLNAALLDPVRGVFGAKPRPSLRPPGTGPAYLSAARLFLFAAGGVFLVAVLIAGDARGQAPELTLAKLSAVFVLVTAGEVSGRFLFYALSGRRN